MGHGKSFGEFENIYLESSRNKNIATSPIEHMVISPEQGHDWRTTVYNYHHNFSLISCGTMDTHVYRQINYSVIMQFA